MSLFSTSLKQGCVRPHTPYPFTDNQIEQGALTYSPKNQRFLRTPVLRNFDRRMREASSLLFQRKTQDPRVVISAFSRNYTVTKMLGSGTFGVVFQAKEGEKDVVIKVINLLDYDKEHGSLSKEATDLEQLHKLDPLHTTQLVDYGVRSMQIKPHYSIPRTFMVTEYGGEEVFRTFLSNKRNPTPLSLENYTHFCYQALLFWRALKNFVPMDIKPENMLVKGKNENTGDNFEEPGSLKFIDLSPLKKEGGGVDSFFIGTSYYRSPELLSKKVGSSTLPFTLGCIFFEMLTLSPLFNASFNPDDPFDIPSAIKHLILVFKLSGEPDQEWIKSLDQNIISQFFVFDFDENIYKLNSAHLDFAQEPILSPDFDFQTWIESTLLEGLNFRLNNDEERIQKIYPKLLDFIMRLIDYKNPPTAEEMIKHPFFADFEEQLLMHDLAARFALLESS